eukprot:COSAG05_NODE_20936_length_275_cov_1.840909_1_plen_91_part_11
MRAFFEAESIVFWTTHCGSSVPPSLPLLHPLCLLLAQTYSWVVTVSMQNSNMRLRGIVRHQRRPKQTVDPRQMKNQLVVDAMALIEPEPEP